LVRGDVRHRQLRKIVVDLPARRCFYGRSVLSDAHRAQSIVRPSCPQRPNCGPRRYKLRALGALHSFQIEVVSRVAGSPPIPDGQNRRKPRQHLIG
jgi:hypothetical protein